MIFSETQIESRFIYPPRCWVARAIYPYLFTMALYSYPADLESENLTVRKYDL